MADVFISYRNTPERRAFARRLATILRAHGVEVWWDFGLAEGESYRQQITDELGKARVVVPLWCAESVQSKWVAMEAELGRDKLSPVRLQNIAPPEAFEAIHAADLIGWDGTIGHPRLQAFVRRLCERLGKPGTAPADTLEELAHLPKLPPLPVVKPAKVAAPMGSVGEPPRLPPPGVPWPWMGATAAVVLAGAWLAAYLAGMPVGGPVPKPTAPVAEEPVAPSKAADDEAARKRQANLAAEEKRKADEAADAAKLARDAETKRKADEAAAKVKAEAEAAARAKAEEAARLKAEADKKAAEEARLAAAADAARKRDPVAALTPGAGKSEFARDRLADGSPCPFCPEMVVVPKGPFEMGSSQAEIDALAKEVPSAAEYFKWEAPRHTVTIQQPFAVGRFAVTFDEWDACVDGGGCKRKPEDQGWGRGNRPVINVSWDEITKEYLPWLNKKTGKTYRLLSEAEREYVTRAGTTTAFSWGPSISTDQANYDGNYTIAGSKKGEYRQKTEPVDSFKPNPWGLYQVHGNVYDWTADCWHDSYKGAPADGSAWTDACTDNSRRVVRGGSWIGYPVYLRSAFRNGFTTVNRYYVSGFRLGRTF